MVKKKSVKKILKTKNEKRKPFSLKREYVDVFNYLKEIRRSIYLIIGVFAFFVLLGAVAPIPTEISEKLLNYFRALIAQTENLGPMGMIWFLFKNNVTASFFGLIFGIVFGIFPLFNAVANGFVLGFASRLSVIENGVFSLWRLFPHGIFELPALFISLGLGFKLGMSVIGNHKRSLRSVWHKSLKTFLMIVLPLLVVAAIIEGLLIVFS